MRAIDKMLQDHQEIAKLRNFFDGFLEAFNKGEAEEYLQRLDKVYNENIAGHFKWEEKICFPFILKECGPSKKKIIQELLNEHVAIADMFAEFKKLISSYDPLARNATPLEIINASQELYLKIVAHAQKEEKVLISVRGKVGNS